MSSISSAADFSDSVFSMARFKLVLAFFALIILCAGVLVAAWFYKNIVAPEQAIVEEIEERATVKKIDLPPPPDLGIRQFAKAVELLKAGELQAAREQLYYVMQYYPDSATYADAKRIVGEINVDLLLSEIPIEGKTEYVVKRGDSLLAIARNNKCTIDYIIRTNSRTTTTIFPGDRLTVFPLDQFSMTIDKSDAAIRIERDGKLFKEYPIVKMALPPMVRAPVSTTISDKVAWGDKGRLNFEQVGYLGANKWISTNKKGLLIRASRDLVSVAAPNQSAAVDDDSKSQPTSSSDYGVMVDQADIEEMFAYIRGNTPVRLIE